MKIRDIILIGLFIGFSITTFLSPEMNYLSSLSLNIFILSLGLFIFSKIPAGLAAWLTIGSGIVLGLPEDILFTSFNQHVIWLMIGAFIIAGVIEESGLLQRMMNWIERKCDSGGRITVYMFILIQLLSVVIPSTSSRATALLPVYRALTRNFEGSGKYFGIAIPVLILMGANLTLIGAGSHIIGIGILESQNDISISYFDFLLSGLPFGLAIGGITILFLKNRYLKNVEFIKKEEVREKEPFTVKEKRAAILIAVTLLLWLTESIHGFDIAFVTMMMSFIMMVPQMGLINWKKGLKNISWSLIFFVAGASALGELLVEYKVTDFFQEKFLSVFEAVNVSSEILYLIVIIIISVTSHLYITSHTTRAVVLIPMLLIFAEMYSLNPAAVTFISLIGINYCVTFPVSSKALLIFYEENDRPFEAADLIRVSMVLMPVYAVLMAAAYFIIWQPLGLSLK